MGYNASTSTYIYLTRILDDILIRIRRRTDRDLYIEDMSSIYSLYRQLCDLSSKYFADSYTGKQTFILPKDAAAQLIQSLQTDTQYRVIIDENKFQFTKNRIEIKFFIRANFVKVLL